MTLRIVFISFLFLVFAPSLISCQQPKKQDFPFKYDLAHPTENIKLPGKLREVSGIDMYRKNKIVCVQDEKGSVYIYDVRKDNLKESVEFGKDHDYEGIANVNDTIFVLKSNGIIFEIDSFDTENQRTVEHKTFLEKENNTEGLCYDKLNNRLLIACKGTPGKGKKGRKLLGTKAIYPFDLATKKMSRDPAYTVDIDSVKEYINTYDVRKTISLEMKEMLKPGKSDEPFAPSEIAIHPITHDIYLLCSVGKLLIVLNDAGTIQYISALNPEIFKQPEGITFYENGDMLISDEGKEHHANILKFAYNQTTTGSESH